MTIATAPRPDRLAAAETIRLSAGAHEDPGAGMCAMELVAYLAGEPHSDHPACACPALARFVRHWNDGLPTDADRDRLLKPIVPALVGTRAPRAVEEGRAWLAIDWLVRAHLPAWLDAAGLADAAAALRAAPEIASVVAALEAAPLVVRAKDEATASSAAREPVLAATYNAAWGTVRATAGPAAWALLGNTDLPAAYGWVLDDAVTAARVAARVSIHGSVRDPVSAEVGHAAGLETYQTEYEAARTAVAWVVGPLQESAVALLRRMIAARE